MLFFFCNFIVKIWWHITQGAEIHVCHHIKTLVKDFFFKPEISISKKWKSEILKSADLGKHFFIIFKEYAIEFLLK